MQNLIAIAEKIRDNMGGLVSVKYGDDPNELLVTVVSRHDETRLMHDLSKFKGVVVESIQGYSSGDFVISIEFEREVDLDTVVDQLSYFGVEVYE